MAKPTRETRLLQLAKETVFSLEQLKKYELQGLANGLVTGYSTLNKPSLIEALLKVSEGYRNELQAKASNIVELLSDPDFSYEFYLKAYEKNEDVKALAKILINHWQAINLKDTTIAKSKPKQLKGCLDLLTANYPKSVDWCESLFTEVRFLVQPKSSSVNKEYGQKVENYGTPDTMMEINGNIVIDWCNQTLTDYVNNPTPDKGWHKVSLALALTTGRRMDEIHGTCRYFAVSDNQLKAVGLSKKPDDENVLISPCLVDNQLWLDAYNHLPENRKGLDNIKINQTISKAITDSLKAKVYPILGINQYKDSRDFYVAYLIKNVWNVDKHGSQLNYAKSLLGHDSKKITLSYEKIKVV